MHPGALHPDCEDEKDKNVRVPQGGKVRPPHFRDEILSGSDLEDITSPLLTAGANTVPTAPLHIQSRHPETGASRVGLHGLEFELGSVPRNPHSKGLDSFMFTVVSSNLRSELQQAPDLRKTRLCRTLGCHSCLQCSGRQPVLPWNSTDEEPTRCDQDSLNDVE